MVFGKELKANFVSDWSANELETIARDIRDVADRQTLKQLEHDHLVIYSVKDYCDHMVHCYGTNQIEVEYVLGISSGD